MEKSLSDQELGQKLAHAESELKFYKTSLYESDTRFYKLFENAELGIVICRWNSANHEVFILVKIV